MGILDFLFADPAKSTLPSPTDALPGRPEPMLVPKRHTVLGTPLDGPCPEGAQAAVFGIGCFWGAEKTFWQPPGSARPPLVRGRLTPNPKYQEVCSGRTGHAEVVRVALSPAQISYTQLLRIFWEHHDPTQGMRQGNDDGTQYRSAIYVADAAQRAAAEASRDAYQAVLAKAGYGAITTEIRRPAVLLRGGLPPAVPGQEPERLLPRSGTGVACPVGLGVTSA